LLCASGSELPMLFTTHLSSPQVWQGYPSNFRTILQSQVGESLPY